MWFGDYPKSYYSRLQCFHRLLKCRPFFRIVKNRRAHENTIILFICQKHTDNPKWLILSTYKKKLLNIFSNFFFYLQVQSFRSIMENNFVQMAASAGHAVAYTIALILKHIIDRLHEFCPLKHQLSMACRRNTYLWQHPTNNSLTVSNYSSEVAKRHQLCGS